MVSESSGAAAGEPQFQVISLHNAELRIREYKRRKKHKKSKAGCLACKKKRVKCDQTTPSCYRCGRSHTECVYDQDDRPPRPPAASARTSPSSSSSSSTSNARPAAAVAAPSRPSFRYLTAPAFPTSAPEYGTRSDILLHHFQTDYSSAIFDTPTFTRSLLPIGASYPHVRNAILAVAASYLRHKVPAVKEHRLAEHYQQSLAIQAYQQALATPLAAHGQEGTDSLLMTAMLMNQLSFALPIDEDPVDGGEPDVGRSWVFSSREDRLGWLAVQMGLSPLLVATRPWRERSFLSPIFRNSDDERLTLSGTWQRLNRVPVAWTTLFGLDREAPPPGTVAPVSDNDRLFRAPLRVLAEIRVLEPHRYNLLRYFQFLGKLENKFRLLMYYREEKALWVFGMWLGLMCRFQGVWWCDRRTRRDFKAIRLWLHKVGVERRPGQEGILWRQLIRDLDATWGYRFTVGAAG